MEDAAGGLRELNTKNKPAFQDKLRQLKDKRTWTHDQFLKEAAPYVRDDKIAEYDQKTDELLPPFRRWARKARQPRRRIVLCFSNSEHG